jgi:hypothetical protein
MVPSSEVHNSIQIIVFITVVRILVVVVVLRVMDSWTSFFLQCVFSILGFDFLLLFQPLPSIFNFNLYGI